MDEVVAPLLQEKALAQTKAKLAELEKNIADLQKLLDARKQSASAEISSKTTPQNDPWQALAVGLIFIAVTGILLLALVRYTRRKEEMANAEEVPQRAAAILAELDLNLEPSPPAEMPAAESLRVKLNLAKAYITIEDFAAARKAIEEILLVSNQVDPQMTISAKSLLSEINQRSDS
jgi:pilus assembly protein FimV